MSRIYKTILITGAAGRLGTELRRGLAPRQAMERLGQPVEIAQAMLWLASDDASICTGTVMVVDGGWTARGDRKPKIER